MSRGTTRAIPALLGLACLAGGLGLRPASAQETGGTERTPDAREARRGAQEEPGMPSQAEAMEAAAWLVGEWRGEGWMQRGPDADRREFTQTESVDRAFGGRLLLVEGVGRARTPEGGAGPVVHHAFGVMSWNPDAGGYRFDTYLAAEAGVRAETEVEDGVIVWGLAVDGGRIRYRIRRAEGEEGDEWHETGEFSPDGSTWYPFLEMRLRRVGP